MKVQVRTATDGFFLLEWSIVFEVWKVRDTNLSYLKNIILGRVIEKPELKKPVIIYLDKTDFLQSSIIVEIKTIKVYK